MALRIRLHKPYPESYQPWTESDGVELSAPERGWTRRFIARTPNGLVCSLEDFREDNLCAIYSVDRYSSFVEALTKDVYISAPQRRRKLIPRWSPIFPSNCRILVPLYPDDEISFGSEATDETFRIERMGREEPQAQVPATQNTPAEQQVPATATQSGDNVAQTPTDEVMMDVFSTATGASGTASSNGRTGNVEMVLDTPKKNYNGARSLRSVSEQSSSIEGTVPPALTAPEEPGNNSLESMQPSLVPAFLTFKDDVTPTPTLRRKRSESIGGEEEEKFSASPGNEENTFRSEQSSLPEGFVMERNKRSRNTYSNKNKLSTSPETIKAGGKDVIASEEKSPTASKRKSGKQPDPLPSKWARTGRDSQGRRPTQAKVVDLGGTDDEEDSEDEIILRGGPPLPSRTISRTESVAETDDESIHQDAQRIVSTYSSFALPPSMPSPTQEPSPPPTTTKRRGRPTADLIKTPKAKGTAKTPASTRRKLSPPPKIPNEFSFPDSAPQETQQPLAPPPITTKSRKRISSASAASSTEEVPNVVFSNSNLDNRKDILSFIKQHGGKKSDSITTPGVNYLVVGAGPLKRTSKLTMAVCLGKTVVTDKWLLESKEAGTLLDPALYLPSDPAHEKQWNFHLPASLARGRTGALTTLFSNMKIHITPSLLALLKSSNQDAEYLEILRLAGAGNVKRVPRGSKCEEGERDKNVVLGIGESEGEKDLDALREGGWRVYRREWVALSILRGQVLEGRDWEVEGLSEVTESQQSGGGRGRRKGRK